MKHLTLFLSLVIFSFSSFSSESYNSIRFTLAADDLEKYKQEDASYVFTGAAMAKVNSTEVVVKKLSTRGQTSIRAPRRSFSVKLDDEVVFNDVSDGSVVTFSSKDFKLVNMWEDNGYVTAQVGYSFFRKFDLYKSAINYAEVFINDVSQGLYLVVDNPETFVKKNLKADCFLRRGYKEKYEIKHPEKVENEEVFSTCENAYSEILKPSEELEGEQLYQYLSQRMNLENYFSWLMINTLLESGDYSDEVFFYAFKNEASPNKMYFDVIAWDPDDIFNKPHLSLENIFRKGKLKKSLLMSLEVKLDRTIDGDDYFENKFATGLLEFLEKEMSDELIDQIVDSVRVKVAPYLDNENVKEMSKLDRLPSEISDIGYTREYTLNLLEQYKARIKMRKKALLGKIKDGR